MSDAPERPTNMTEFQKAIWEIYDLRERIAALEAERDSYRKTTNELAERVMMAEAKVARLREALKDVIEGWDWWRKDEYDRDQSVVQDAIDEARTALERTGEHDK